MCKVLQDKSEYEEYQKRANYAFRREQDAITEDNIHNWRSNDLYLKSMSASSLKHALSSSSSFSKSMLEYEKLEKNALKGSRISRFSEYSTFKVCFESIIMVNKHCLQSVFAIFLSFI